QLTGLEKFGSLPGYVLLALSLQIYGDKTHVDDLSERAERLGGEIDRNLTTEVLRAMSRNIQVEGKPLIKEVGGNSWALSYAVRRTREECIEVLNRLGLSDAQSNRFLA